MIRSILLFLYPIPSLLGLLFLTEKACKISFLANWMKICRLSLQPFSMKFEGKKNIYLKRLLCWQCVGLAGGLPITYSYGPCSRLGQKKSPSRQQIFLQDQSRVRSINAKIFSQYSTQESKDGYSLISQTASKFKKKFSYCFPL